MNTTSHVKPQALILISSARQLPLAAPASVPSIPTGFFLVELAQVLKEFENDYEFTFATPDGNPPQLDINGMGLAFHATDKLGPATLTTTIQQRARSFDTGDFRRRHAGLAARREQELQLLERHLGRLPVSEILPNTDREAAAFRPELLRRLEPLGEQTSTPSSPSCGATGTRMMSSPSPASTSSTPPAATHPWPTSATIPGSAKRCTWPARTGCSSR